MRRISEPLLAPKRGSDRFVAGRRLFVTAEQPKADVRPSVGSGTVRTGEGGIASGERYRSREGRQVAHRPRRGDHYDACNADPNQTESVRRPKAHKQWDEEYNDQQDC